MTLGQGSVSWAGVNWVLERRLRAGGSTGQVSSQYPGTAIPGMNGRVQSIIDQGGLNSAQSQLEALEESRLAGNPGPFRSYRLPASGPRFAGHAASGLWRQPFSPGAFDLCSAA